jgi:hypothetical protein
MANMGHLKIINEGVQAWAKWRDENPKIRPDLNSADLSDINLDGFNLIAAELKWANLSKSRLRRANLAATELNEANLFGADLRQANLLEADLSGANLSCTGLAGTDLKDAILTDADLSRSEIGWTTFANNDLSTVKGLENVVHIGPSTIGVDTLFKSDGKIPEKFLLGAGIPEDFITFLPSLIGRAIEFYSCFISYSHSDEEFSRRLHSRMRTENLRVWYAPEDVRGGRKLHEEIFQAIQIHDKLLLVLSNQSMESEWVITEVRRARKVEREQGRRKLFPIRLIDFEAIQKWECFDADSGKDLAVELREYHIPDFSNWKDHDSFEKEFAKLLRDLRANAG